MVSRPKIRVIILFLIFLLSGRSYGQTVSQGNSVVNDLIVQLENSNWESRKEAFFGLMQLGRESGEQTDPDDPSIHEESWQWSPEYDETIRSGFIKLLERETAFLQRYDFERSGVPLGEGYGEGYR